VWVSPMTDEFLTLEDDGIPWGDSSPQQETAQPRWNQTSAQWSSRPIDMQKSAAYRVLNKAEHMMLDRIEIELASHGGNDNGALPVTFSDFEEYGIRRALISPSRRALVKLGFITFTQGRHSSPTLQDPNLFGVTYKVFIKGREAKPTNAWRRLPDGLAECAKIADAARNTNDDETAKRRRGAPVIPGKR
jgi:hypothetical protein